MQVDIDVLSQIMIKYRSMCNNWMSVCVYLPVHMYMHMQVESARRSNTVLYVFAVIYPLPYIWGGCEYY